MKKITLWFLSLFMMLALLVSPLPAMAADQAQEEQTVRITTVVTGGTITPGQDVARGSDVELTWQANEERSLQSVTVDGEELNPEDYAEGITLKSVQEDHQVEVVFSAEDKSDEAQAEDSDVTYGVVNGTMELVTPSQAKGAVLACYAPKKGYAVSQVLVDGQEADLEKYPTAYLFDDNKAHQISVICTPLEEEASQTSEKSAYTIETSALGGRIDPEVSVKDGGRARIFYQPNMGWKLMEVVVDGKPVENPDPTSYTFENVQGPHSIQVIFEKAESNDQTLASIQAMSSSSSNSSDQADGEVAAIGTVKANDDEDDAEQPLYTITTAVRNGTIDESTAVKSGGSITIHYSPNPGYSLRKLILDGEELDIGDYPTEYTLTDVDDDHRFYAVFRKGDSSDSSATSIVQPSSNANSSNSSSGNNSTSSRASVGSAGADTGDTSVLVLLLALLILSGVSLPVATRRRK